MRVDELFRGPLRVGQFEVEVRHGRVEGCLLGAMGRGKGNTPMSQWLLVGGGVGKGEATNRSVVTGGGACGKGVVWMTPWELLNQEVVEEIRNEGGEGDMWWRRRRAWVEFGGSLRRASLVDGGRREIGWVAEGEHAEGEWWLKDGVSLVAACKDRGGTLGEVIASWKAVRGVDEIVVVDWSSSPTIVEEVGSRLGGGKVVVVRVEGQSDWVLSRAYNLGVRMARFGSVVKVDCDTHLEPDFLEAHALESGAFYAGDWRQLESVTSEELHVNGLLYVHRDDFLAVGGYDERITTYGWDDSDIAERLSKKRRFKRMDYSKVRHIMHSASLRVVNQRTTSLLPPENPHAAAVEIQRNRILLTKFNLPDWKAMSLHTQWNVLLLRKENTDNAMGPARVFSVTAANEVTPVSSLVSDSDALDVAKRSLRLILHRYGVQLLPKSLSLEFYKELMTKVAFPEQYAEVVLSLRGGCASRLLAYAASNQAATGLRLKDESSGSYADSTYVWPPLPYRGWRLQGLWIYPDQECSCKFSNVFDAKEEEIISAWFDKANPLHPYVPISKRQPSSDVTSILKSFDAKAKEKVLSSELLKWTNTSERHGKHSKPRILTEDLACDLDPQQAAPHRRELIRAQFRSLSPSKDVQESVLSSLLKHEDTILDSPLLSRHMWPKLVGDDYTSQVTHTFTASGISAMAETWGPTSLPSDQLVHRLDRRAASLAVAVRMSDRGVRMPNLLTPLQSQQLNETLTTLSKRIERLFTGCPSPPSNYLEAYPELALALAGFLSCGTCV